MEILRQCLPPSVRPTLRELPESLDTTYERILKEIKKPNKRLAQRVLQSLVIAVRPLRVEELAEVLAVDFDDAEGIPRLKPDWRWEEQELALLSACSNLIAIVRAGDSRVVQFSHFSVKEFLTSPRLATATREVSNYHIGSGPAHRILAQACLAVLLQIQYDVEGCTPKDHPLAEYAAKHWTTHAQLGEELSPRLHKGMECLFDANKPHFKVWVALYDIDTRPEVIADYHVFSPFNKSPAVPLYYAALCGFAHLVEHLITMHPQDVNANGGYYVRPLVAALAGEHLRTAYILRHNGADLDFQDIFGRNLLHTTACHGNFKVVQILIESEVDINARDEDGVTPLGWASGGERCNRSVVRLLLEHGADIKAQTHSGQTALHRASSHYGALEVVRVLLEHGVDVEAKDDDGMTALQIADSKHNVKIMKIRREHGASEEASVPVVRPARPLRPPLGPVPTRRRCSF